MCVSDLSRVKQEVDDVIGMKQEISFDDLGKMTYLSQVNDLPVPGPFVLSCHWPDSDSNGATNQIQDSELELTSINRNHIVRYTMLYDG